MNRLALLLVLFVLSLPAHAAETTFIKNDWEKARALAAAEKKMLLVDFYTDWCSWCRVMDTTTFRDSAVAAFINEKFVALSIDAEKNFGVTVAMKYRIGAYPSYGYFTPDGRMVMKSLGYEPAADYLKTLQDAVGRNEAGRMYEGVTPATDLAYPEFLPPAYGSKGERKTPAPGIVDEWLNAQKDLLGEVSFTVICRFTTPPKVTEFFLANAAEYVRLYGDDDVDMKVSAVISDQLSEAIKGKDKALLEKTLETSDRYGKGDRMENRRGLTMRYYRGIKEWRTYAGMVDAEIKSGRMQESGVNSAAWSVYEQCDDAAVISMAAGWMDRVVTTSPTYAYLDTYAAILYKGGRSTLAEEYALKAIEKGKAEGEDVASTEELLKKIRAQAP